MREGLRPAFARLLPLLLALTPVFTAAVAVASAPSAKAPQTDSKTATGTPPLVQADPAAIKKAIAQAGGSAVLVNIWATWCGPCREEFPDLLRVRRDLGSSGLKVILVSADFDDTRKDAEQFLREHGVDFPTYIKTGRDEDLIQALAPQWSGALPTTLIYDGQGTLQHVLEGKQTYATFHDKVVQVIRLGRKGT
jgi:thiol-disulfide isomerase/thioredoxin